MGYDQALKMIEKNGGKISENEILIKTQKVVPVKFEENFTGHFPVEIKKINARFSDTVKVDFEGIGIVLRGNVFAKDNIKADKYYIAKAEVYLNNELIETISLPLNNTTRKTEIFWRYQLPLKNHTLSIKWLNPDDSVDVRVSEALIYSDKPAVSVIKLAENN
jgi:hypothetical protein